MNPRLITSAALLVALLARTAAAQDRNAVERGKKALEKKKEAAPAPAPAPVPPPPAAPIPAPTPAATTTPPTTAQPPPPVPSPEDSELYKCKNLPPNVKIKVNFKPESDVKDLIAWVMGFTCKSFIFGTAIAGKGAKVTLIAPKEMTPVDAYRLFLVSLQVMGLTVVPKGNVMEIIEAPRGNEAPLPVYKSGGAVPATDQLVRVVIRPEFISVEDLNVILNTMKSAAGKIQSISSAGVLIVTDYGSMIDRMMDVLKEIDAPLGAEKIYIIPLRSADATDMAQKLTEIFGIGRGGAAPSTGGRPPTTPPGQPPPPTASVGGGSGGSGGAATPSKIIADQRTNSLLVIGSERAYQRILALVSRLDGDAEAGGQIHVYYLNYAEAEDLGNVLNALITGQAQARTTQQQPGQPGQQPPRPQPAPAAPGGVVGQGPAFEGQVRLTHDKATNSLVIVSSAKDFLAMKDVIKKLDIARRQVYVEAHILEVTLNKTNRIGAAYHGGTTVGTSQGDALIFTGVEGAELNSLNPLASAATLTGLLGGAVGPQIPGFSIPSFGVLFQILQSNTDVNVLSSPNILTTDNEQAEITVGQNIPYQAGITGLPALSSTQTPGQTSTTGLSGFPFQSIQRQDVALTLKLKPHINDSDYMRLEVELEVNDLAGQDPTLGPIWSKRKVKSPIVVKDQQPVVLGGLIQEKYNTSVSKVPLLGDIPILGYLFKQERREKVKTNLLIFLTPYIVKDQADLQRIFEQKISERKEFIESYSTFQAMDFQPNVDYRRKRGLLEDINRAVQQNDDDVRAYEESIKTRKHLEPGPVEMPLPAPQPPPGPVETPPPKQ